jgi:hypothetical protein
MTTNFEVNQNVSRGEDFGLNPRHGEPTDPLIADTPDPTLGDRR